LTIVNAQLAVAKQKALHLVTGFLPVSSQLVSIVSTVGICCYFTIGSSVLSYDSLILQFGYYSEL
jgi:photosystem I subunit III